MIGGEGGKPLSTDDGGGDGGCGRCRWKPPVLLIRFKLGNLDQGFSKGTQIHHPLLVPLQLTQATYVSYINQLN